MNAPSRCNRSRRDSASPAAEPAELEGFDRPDDAAGSLSGTPPDTPLGPLDESLEPLEPVIAPLTQRPLQAFPSRSAGFGPQRPPAPAPVYLADNVRTFANPISYLGGPRLLSNSTAPRTSKESVLSLD